MQKINNNLNMLWVGIFLFLLAISAPWFNLTVSSHDLVKSYFAAFGVAILMLASLAYKSYNSEINFKINYVKL